MEKIDGENWWRKKKRKMSLRFARLGGKLLYHMIVNVLYKNQSITLPPSGREQSYISFFFFYRHLLPSIISINYYHQLSPSLNNITFSHQLLTTLLTINFICSMNRLWTLISLCLIRSESIKNTTTFKRQNHTFIGQI